MALLLFTSDRSCCSSNLMLLFFTAACVSLVQHSYVDVATAHPFAA